MKTIKKFWWRLVPPREVSAIKSQVQVVLDKHAGTSRTVLERQIAMKIADVELMIYSVREKGWTPTNIAMMVTRNALEGLISSGQHHVYRGTLSGVGTDLLKTLKGVVSDMQTAGEMADVDMDDYFKSIHEQIQSAG